MDINEIQKKVKLNLVGQNGNAFVLLSLFRQRAKLEKWTKEEIQAVLDKAMDSDYSNLLTILSRFCEP